MSNAGFCEKCNSGYLAEQGHACPMEALGSKPEDFALNVMVENGKYTVRQGKDGRLHALRHGEEWRDLCGDGLVYALAAEVERLREQVNLLEENN